MLLNVTAGVSLCAYFFVLQQAQVVDPLHWIVIFLGLLVLKLK